jgi:hypothetical protein
MEGNDMPFAKYLLVAAASGVLAMTMGCSSTTNDRSSPGYGSSSSSMSNPDPVSGAYLHRNQDNAPANTVQSGSGAPVGTGSR